MKLNLALLFIALFIIGIVTYLFNSTSPHIQEVPIPITKEITTKEITPNFLMTDITNTNHELTDFKGKVVVLNFWASWCAPCVIEFPQLLDMARSTQDDTILLFISVDAQKENIERFLEKIRSQTGKDTHISNVHYIWDPQKKISQDLFSTIKYPETYILGPDLTVEEKIIGAGVDFSSTEFIEHLMTYAAPPTPK